MKCSCLRYVFLEADTLATNMTGQLCAMIFWKFGQAWRKDPALCGLFRTEGPQEPEPVGYMAS